jgi:hypothetical protein
MQIVIYIPEEIYKASQIIDVKYEDVIQIPLEVIKNGTPLPKGHGRLIDADELKEHKYHDNHRYENAVAVAYIDCAPTIIEADKEGAAWN